MKQKTANPAKRRKKIAVSAIRPLAWRPAYSPCGTKRGWLGTQAADGPNNQPDVKFNAELDAYMQSVYEDSIT